VYPYAPYQKTAEINDAASPEKIFLGSPTPDLFALKIPIYMVVAVARKSRSAMRQKMISMNTINTS
jgi:hypothetical protein